MVVCKEDLIEIREKRKMPRTEEANQRIRDERKRQIVHVAVRVFARQGVAATKMADIAAEGEMSQGLFYRYFSNKEEILVAIMERGMESTMRLGKEAMELPLGPVERLRWLVGQLVRGLWNSPEYGLVMQDVLTSQATPEVIREQGLKLALEFQSLLHRLIVEGQEAGEIAREDDAMELTVMIGACIEGLTTARAYAYAPELVNPNTDIIMRLLKRTP